MTAPRFPYTFTGDGTTKSFSLGFPILSQDHVRVIVNGVLQIRGTNYYIQNPQYSGNSGYPTVYFPTAPGNALAIKFYRNTPLLLVSGNPEIGPRSALYALMRAEELGDQRITLQDSYGQTALLAGTALSFAAPCDGYIEKLRGTVLKAVTTGGAVTAEVDGVAVTGLTFTVADADAAGTTYSDVPATPQSTTTKVRRGQTITITPAAAFATAGDLAVALELQPADF